MGAARGRNPHCSQRSRSQEDLWGPGVLQCHSAPGLSDSQDVGFGDYFGVGLFLAQKTIYNIERHNF